jgi:uracil-DNA glycosylase family 4
MPLNLFGQQTTARGEILGCSACPLDRQPNTNKVLGLDRIKRRRAMLWSQSPGAKENERELELVGQSGQLLWRTLKQFGLTRNHFDVQNVVRCQPRGEDGQNRDPEKRELTCCSVYNQEALELNRGRAAIHVILGEIAGAQLLGDDFKKDRPVFWYAPWDAYVLYNWHPSYLLRNEDESRDTWEYQSWRDRFAAVWPILEHPGRFGYLKSRDYRTVRTHAEFDEMERALRAEQAAGRRVSNDVEAATVDGKRVMTMSGFGTGHFKDAKNYTDWTSTCWSVVLDHPESGYEPTHLREMQQRVKKLVEDPELKKTYANGNSDEEAYVKAFGARVRGYDYDTQYGTFLRYSFLRACGLEPLMYRFFPEFADYKEIVGEWDFRAGNFTKGTIENLVLRNCGDCEVTQKLEQRFSGEVKPELVKVYIHAGKVLSKMESRGPILDRQNWQKAMTVVPEMIEKLDRQLQHVSGEPNFNCGSDKQVAWLIYDVLGLEPPEGVRSTGKEILNLLLAESGNKTLELVMKNRGLRIIRGTFLNGYARSADKHGGELRTIWWLTGAVTGRLRSGKGTRDEEEGIVNFQNLHGNPLLMNLLVSDKNWRLALQEPKK